MPGTRVLSTNFNSARKIEVNGCMVFSKKSTINFTGQPFFSKIKSLVAEGKSNGQLTEPKIENKLFISVTV